MSDNLSAKLIVMDPGPLITLAAADSLEYLLYSGVPLYIPDAVLYEATRDAAALGAQQILDWAQQNSEQVHTISTETFFNYIQSRETNRKREPNSTFPDAGVTAMLGSVIEMGGCGDGRGVVRGS